MNDTEIAKAKRDFELKKAAYDVEVQTKVIFFFNIFKRLRLKNRFVSRSKSSGSTKLMSLKEIISKRLANVIVNYIAILLHFPKLNVCHAN
jgi:hypothetical protein